MTPEQIQQMQDANVSGGGMLGGMLVLIIYLGIIVVMFASMWKLFAKAGKPGWASLVPIYNLIVILDIAGKPAWWLVLFLIPFVNFIAGVIVAISLAAKFGKSTGFAIGMILLPFVFYPLLAFGDASYQE